jgi:two-component system LytT family response regulator
VVVADDERPARSFLVAMLRSFEDVHVVGEAASGKRRSPSSRKRNRTLPFSIGRCRNWTVWASFRQLRKQSMPLIAFVTAYDEYAVRAFEVNALTTS